MLNDADYIDWCLQLGLAEINTCNDYFGAIS